MSLKAMTILDQREIRGDGTLQLRFEKRIESNGAIISSHWHRTALPPGANIDNQFKHVNAHLIELGFPAVSAEDMVKIKATAAAEWTPKVVETYQTTVKELLNKALNAPKG